MIGESNQGSSTLQFTWFCPGSYVTAPRNIFSPFQGAQADIEGRIAIPVRGLGPVDEPTHIIDDGSEPTNPLKKPKTSDISDDVTPISSNTKQSKKGPSKSKKVKASSSTKRERKNLSFASYESSMDASDIPTAVCTCTGVAHPCYRCGSWGWQSSCCTTNISEYPLPMSTTKPGSRLPGRKMSNGAFEKLLQRLAAQGYDFTLPIDLKDHWAKHGTNKFVTIK